MLKYLLSLTGWHIDWPCLPLRIAPSIPNVIYLIRMFCFNTEVRWRALPTAANSYTLSCLALEGSASSHRDFDFYCDFFFFKGVLCVSHVFLPQTEEKMQIQYIHNVILACSCGLCLVWCHTAAWSHPHLTFLNVNLQANTNNLGVLYISLGWAWPCTRRLKKL